MHGVSSERVYGSSVLVLNRYFLAVHVIGVRRAFGLLYRDLAEVIQIDRELVAHLADAGGIGDGSAGSAALTAAEQH